MMLSADSVHAQAPVPASEPSAARPYRRTCLECGAPHSAAMAHGDFCATACRHAFNNRRRIRGADLYDLVMAWRFDRSVATSFKVLRAICRLASDFRAEDRSRRAGRASWRHPRKIKRAKPALFTTYLTAARDHDAWRPE